MKFLLIMAVKIKNHLCLKTTEAMCFEIKTMDSVLIARKSSKCKFSVCLYEDFCKTMISNIHEHTIIHQSSKNGTHQINKIIVLR